MLLRNHLEWGLGKVVVARVRQLLSLIRPAACVLFAVGFLCGPADARDWYARPYAPAGYGSSDGKSYGTAFNGMHGGAIDWNQIAPGDTLRICGFHDGGGLDYGTHRAANPVLFVNSKHGLPGQPITVTGECLADPGTIFGASMKYETGWTLLDAASNVYSRSCPMYPENRMTFRHVHARPRGADKADGIFMLNPGDPASVSSWAPGTFGRATDGTCFFKPPAATANDYTVFVAYQYPNINFQDTTYFRIERLTLLNGNNTSFGSSIGVREGTRYIVVDNVRIRWADGAAIGVGRDSTDAQITNNEISDSGLGIYLSGNASRTRIAGNKIYNLNQRGEFGPNPDLHAIALQGGGDSILIEDNDIYDIGGEGIVIYFDPGYVAGLTNTIIRQNRIRDIKDLSGSQRNQRGIEFGGHNIATDTIYGNEIYGNTIRNIGNPTDDPVQRGIGIRLKALWNPAKGPSWRVYDNEIENANIGLVWLHDNDVNKGPGFTFTNNTVLGSRSQHVYLFPMQLGNFDFNGAQIDGNRYFPDGLDKFVFFTDFNVRGVFHDPRTGNFQQWRSATGKDGHSVILSDAPPLKRPAAPSDVSVQ